MNSTVYFEGHIKYYKTWKNSLENSGATICFGVVGYENRLFAWNDIHPKRLGHEIGATCLARW